MKAKLYNSGLEYLTKAKLHNNGLEYLMKAKLHNSGLEYLMKAKLHKSGHEYLMKAHNKQMFVFETLNTEISMFLLKFSKEHNSIKNVGGVTSLNICTSFDYALYSYQVSQNAFKYY